MLNFMLLVFYHNFLKVQILLVLEDIVIITQDIHFKC
jgi:hypothetical protein